MTTVQTSTGAATFIKVGAAPGASVPSQLNLRDGITIQPAADGTLTVRTSDFPPLQSIGLVSLGPATPEAFRAGVLSGSGSGAQS